jgi:hypothetical protein
MELWCFNNYRLIAINTIELVSVVGNIVSLLISDTLELEIESSDYALSIYFKSILIKLTYSIWKLQLAMSLLRQFL